MEGEEETAGEWAPLRRNLASGGRGNSEVRRENWNPDHVDGMPRRSRGGTRAVEAPLGGRLVPSRSFPGQPGVWS